MKTLSPRMIRWCHAVTEDTQVNESLYRALRSNIKRQAVQGVDWSKPNSIIANELEVSRQRVSQLRKGKGAAQSPFKHNPAFYQFTQTEGLGNKTAREIANELGITIETVRKYAKKIGVSLKRPTKYDWDSADWETKSNAEIAEQLGMGQSSSNSVSRMRARYAPHTVGRFAGARGHKSWREKVLAATEDE
jgi:hypothetical protein